MTKVLGTEDWLETVTYYDDKYREIKSISQNHLGGTDVLENTYENDVLDLVNQTVTVHTSSEHTGELRETQLFTYDHTGSVTEVNHKVNNEDEIILSKNTYNEIGEAKRKQLHSSNGSSFIQSVDYEYNIRGWLSAINDISSLGSSDKFGMKLDYDEAGQYNGNIGKITWKTLGGGSLNQNEQEYTYSYDDLNRLKKATYTSYGAANHFTVGGNDNGQIRYDLNGNIMSLNRNFNGSTVDVLDYHYSGNQLIEVEDSGTNSLFRDKTPANGENDYKYDANGNMVSDLNKEVSQINYNHLNLVELVVFENGDFVKYVYDGSGKKLRKESKIGASVKIKDYTSGKHYEDGTLTFFHHGDGRVRLANDTFLYEYNLEDHLENARVSINSTGNVIQRDDYFPFGLTFNHYAQSPENLYKFIGKEEQEETKWTDFGARMYMSDIGRWGALDPLSEKYLNYSPYNYAGNNPIIFIDPNGKEIVYVGTKKFQRKMKRNLKYLKQHSPSAYIKITQLEVSSNLHVIRETPSPPKNTKSKKGQQKLAEHKANIKNLHSDHQKKKISWTEFRLMTNPSDNPGVISSTGIKALRAKERGGHSNDKKNSDGTGTNSILYISLEETEKAFDKESQGGFGIRSNYNKKGSKSTNFWGLLAHEMFHMWSADTGTQNDVDESRAKQEQDAVDYENIVTDEINKSTQ